MFIVLYHYYYYYLFIIFVIMIVMFWDLLRLQVSTLVSELFKTESGSCVAGEQQLLIISG